MTPWILTLGLLVAHSAHGHVPCQPLWKVELAKEHGFRAFGSAERARQPPEMWKFQEGVVFLSPELLAVYQVHSESDNVLAPRDQSGGAGRFFLQVEILDTGHGKPVKSVHLQTSSRWSAVLPTHDGRYLLRTGDVVRLYSATFEELASKSLPLSPPSRNEGWYILVSPQGRRIYLQHNEMPPSRSEPAGSLLDADTLQTLATLDPGNVGVVSVDENSQLLGAGDFGTLYGPIELDGTWHPLFRMVFPGDASCERGTRFLRTSPPIFATFGCNVLRFVSTDGRELATFSVGWRDTFLSAVGGDSIVAAEVGHRVSDPLDLGLRQGANRILVFDQVANSEKCFIPVSERVSLWSFKYAVSSGSSIAVIQRDILTLYKP